MSGDVPSRREVRGDCAAARPGFLSRQRLRRPPVPASWHLRPGPGGRITGGRARRPAGAAGAASVVDLQGGTLAARVHRRARAPAVRRGAAARLRPARGRRQRRNTWSWSPPTPAITPTQEWITGGGWSLDAFPGGMPRPRGAGRGRARPPGVPAQPRRARRVGQQPGARASRDRPFDPGSAGRPHRARRRRRRPPACSRRAPPSWSPACCPPATEDDWDQALLAAQSRLLSLGITGWQDAIVGRDHGGHGADPLDAYLRAARAGTLLANVVGALWWDREPRPGPAPRAAPAPGTPGRPGGSGPPA